MNNYFLLLFAVILFLCSFVASEQNNAKADDDDKTKLQEKQKSNLNNNNGLRIPKFVAPPQPAGADSPTTKRDTDNNNNNEKTDNLPKNLATKQDDDEPDLEHEIIPDNSHVHVDGRYSAVLRNSSASAFDTKSTGNKETENSKNLIQRQNNQPLPHFSCPAASTAEGVWGLNSDPYFTSSDFYHQTPPYATNKSLGRWIVGSRTGMLQQFCRLPETKLPQNQVHRAAATSNWEACEWGPKPVGFNPFQGGIKYSLSTTAAIYWTDGVSSNNNNNASKNPSGRLSFCYDFQSAGACLADKVIVFVGDSHTLNLAELVCRMAAKNAFSFEPTTSAAAGGGGNNNSQQGSRNYNINDPNDPRRFGKGICGQLDGRFTKPVTAVYIPGVNTTIVLLRARYDLRDQWYRFNAHPWARLFYKASHVVTSRGMWDVVYKDTPRKILTAQFADSLKFLARNFPFARIIVKLTHYDHDHMKGCSSDARLWELRSSNICSVYIAQTEIAQELQSLKTSLSEANRKKNNDNDNNNKNISSDDAFDPYKKFAILDIYGASREIPSREAVDDLGHHYEGSVVESMTQQLLSIMCPPPNTRAHQNHTKMYFENFMPIGKQSCKKIRELTPQQSKRMPICSCNDVENGGYKTPAALEFCSKFYKSPNIWVAYFTDV